MTKPWLILSTVALLAVAAAIAFSCCDLDLDAPNEALCPQADALLEARLLEKAEAVYASAEGAGERCGKQEQAERKLARAERHFAVGNVYASASPPPKSADGTESAQPSFMPFAIANSSKAIDEFADGLDLNPFDNNASLALGLELDKGIATSERECTTGSNLASDGLLKVAGVALSKGLEREDGSCEAGVKTLRGAYVEASTHLRDARGAGDTSAARDSYVAALQANANLAAAQTGLEGTLDEDSCLDEAADLIASVLEALKTALVWLIPVLVALLILAVALWMFVRELSARLGPARRGFEKLGKHPGFTFFYRAAVPDIEVKAFGGKGEGDLEGDAFSTLLVAEVGEQARRKPGFPFDRITTGQAPETSTTTGVVDLLNEIPATKVLGSIAKVLSKLFRRRKILLTGHLVPPSDEGAGVLLSVEGARRGRDKTVTIRERTYDPNPGGKGAARWLRLIPAAGVWARWHLQAAQDPTAKNDEIEKWRADALFESAQAWQVKEDRRRARTLYTRALELDRELLPATHNLAVVELREAEYAKARKREEAVRAAVAGPKGKELTKKWPTLDTASLYTLMLTLVYPEIDPSANSAEADLKEAVTKGQGLVKTLVRELEPTEDGDKKRKKEEEARDPLIKEELELAELPSVIILASLTVRLEQAQREDAVNYALSAGRGVLPIDRGDLVEETVKVEDLTSWQLIHGYALKEGKLPLSRRTHYNLACYYTTLREYTCRGRQGAADTKALEDLALESLRTALIGGNLNEWVRKDPSLAPLWKAREKDLQKIVDAHAIAPHPDEEEKKEKEGDDKTGPPASLRERLAILAKRIEASWRAVTGSNV